MSYEKKDITVILKVKSIENKKLNEVKDNVVSLTSEFNISLLMNQEIDENIIDNTVVIEYYSKANGDEIIGESYLKFLDSFIEIGYVDGVKTVPME